MPKSNQSILKSIHSLEKQIEEHQNKILEALDLGKGLQYIDHWEKEIQTFWQTIQKLKRKLKA